MMTLICLIVAGVVMLVGVGIAVAAAYVSADAKVTELLAGWEDDL